MSLFLVTTTALPYHSRLSCSKLSENRDQQFLCRLRSPYSQISEFKSPSMRGPALIQQLFNRSAKSWAGLPIPKGYGYIIVTQNSLSIVTWKLTTREQNRNAFLQEKCSSIW